LEVRQVLEEVRGELAKVRGRLLQLEEEKLEARREWDTERMDWALEQVHIYLSVFTRSYDSGGLFTNLGVWGFVYKRCVCVCVRVGPI
jgi:transposase